MIIQIVNPDKGLQELKYVEKKQKPPKRTFIPLKNMYEREEKTDMDEFYDKYKLKFSSMLEEKKEEICRYLDTEKMEGNDTFKEKLIKMFGKGIQEKDIQLRYSDNILAINSILEEGFDFDNIKNTTCSLGYIFDTKEQRNPEYQRQALKIFYEGNTSLCKENIKDYNNLCSDVVDDIRKYLKLPSVFDMKYLMEFQALKKFVNKHARELIVCELGIDGAYIDKGSKNQKFIVFNPDSIQGIRGY